MEQLDHRQLLSVNFTGNVATDFPASQTPGVVVLPDNASVTHPGIPNNLQNLVKVSGFDISGIRTAYDPTTDTLSIGIEQPPSQQPGQPGPVIAGDADNNGNDGTVNPAVSAVSPGFQDNPDFGGTEFMGIFLDLNGDNKADIVAGYSQDDQRSPKQYQVALASDNSTLEFFGTMLPQFTGNVFKVNSPVHPDLEFNINNFSQLYLQETGKQLTPDAIIGMGAFAGSGNDGGIGEAFFPQQNFTFSQVEPPPTPPPPPPPQPPPPPPCPPMSPPVQVNPHLNHHINTAHPTDIRATVFGTSNFDVSQIDPSTVEMGGAHPIFAYERDVNHDGFLDETYIFKGTDVKLPAGITNATVTGTFFDGKTTFITSQKVFNRDASFYPLAEVASATARQAANPNKIEVPLSVLAAHVERAGDRVVFMNPDANAGTQTASSLTPDRIAAASAPGTGPVVSIRRRQPSVAANASPARTPVAQSRISPRLQGSLNSFVNDSTSTSAS